MGFKRFGKLAGNTNAPASVAENAAANTLTPYAVQPGGTKFLAWGEGASSLAFNRALSALQENIEQIGGVLDAPALAETRIYAGDNHSGAQKFGTRALYAVPDGATTINLATLSNSGNPGLAPIYWVYTGLHEPQLRKFIRLFRYTDNNVNAPINALESVVASSFIDARTANLIYPNGARTKAAGTNIFIDPVTGTTQAYATSTAVQSFHSLSQYIPPIKYVDSDLPPYSGATVTDTVAQWWNDGVSLSGFTWRELYMRPGCFAHVTGAGPNNGLYRIAEIRNLYANASDKAILTRGGLHKVKVAAVAPFTAGRLLTWAPSPLGGVDPPSTSILNNFAYLVFKDTAENVLYLADLPGEEDFGTESAGTQWGQKVDNTGTVPASADNIGTVGQVDLEAGAGSSYKLLPGQLIFDAGDLTKKTTVVSVTQSNTPIQFDTTQTGSVTPCNPLGFTLNPTLEFAAGSIQKGNYLVQCKRLSTVRENLNTPGSTAQFKIIPNAADTLNYSELEAGLVRTFAKYIKTGEETATARTAGNEYVAGPFTASSMLLGDGLWKVRFSTVGPTLESVATINSVQPVVTPAPHSAYTYARVQSVSTNTAVLSDVSTRFWSDDQRIGYSQSPIVVGSTLTIGLNTFTVDQVQYIPYLRAITAGGTLYPRVPTLGLDAAYHAHYSASITDREHGAGGYITLAPYAPVRLLQPTRSVGGVTATNGGVGVLTSGNTSISSVATNNLSQTLIEQVTPVPAAPPSTYASIGVASAYSGAMVFKDTNILAGNFPALVTGIPLTNALQYTLNPPFGGFISTSIVGGITEQSGPFLAARGASGGDGKAGAEIIRAPFLEVPAGTSVTFGTAIAGANVTVTSYGVGYYNGYYYEIPTQTIAIPNGFSQLVWDGSLALGSQYKFITGEATNAQATVAFAFRSAPNTTFYNTALLSQYENRKDSVITVGSTGAMFTTLADAVDAVYGLTTLGVGNATRTYIIEVRGGTTETRTVSFKSGNILVRGLPGRQLSAANETLASITWSGNRACIDFNGNSHIAIRDLYLRYDSGALGASTTQNRVAFTNSSAAVSTNITIDNVNIRSVNAGRLHGYFNALGAGGLGVSWLSVRNCVWSDATDYGIILACGNTVIENNTITGDGALTQAGNIVPQGYIGGILIYSPGTTSFDSFIKFNKVTGWLRYGVGVNNADKLWVQSNTIYNIASADAQIQVPAGNIDGARAYGITLVSASNSYVINNRVESIATSTTNPANPAQWCYGIYTSAGSTKCAVESNNVSSVSPTSVAVNAFGIQVAGAGSKVCNNWAYSLSSATNLYGFYTSGNKTLVTGNTYDAGTLVTNETAITVAGNNCIVDANQTGGMTGAGQTAINVTGLNNSIGAMNRDDA